jgi:hypothetical protein
MTASSPVLVNPSQSVDRFRFNSTAAAESAIAFLKALIEYGGVPTASPYEFSSPVDPLPQTIVEHLANWEVAMNPHRLGFGEFDGMSHLWAMPESGDDELLAARSLTAALGWVLRFLGAEGLCGGNLMSLDRVSGFRLANSLAHAIWDSAVTLHGNQTSLPLPPIFMPPPSCNLSDTTLAADDIIVGIVKIRQNLVNHTDIDIWLDSLLFQSLGHLAWFNHRLPNTGYEPCRTGEMWVAEGAEYECAHEGASIVNTNFMNMMMLIGQFLRRSRDEAGYAVVYPRDIPLWRPDARKFAIALIKQHDINLKKWQRKLWNESKQLCTIGTANTDTQWQRYSRQVRLHEIGIDPAQEIQVSGLSGKIIAGTTATVCPTANPPLPAANLHLAEHAIRQLYSLPKGSTIHWCGHDAGARGLCQCHPDESFLGSLPDTPSGFGNENPPGRVDELRGLIKALRLKGNDAKIVTAICNGGGEVPLKDLMVLFEWDKPDIWNSARQRLNSKLKPKGWMLSTHDKKAIAETATLADL